MEELEGFKATPSMSINSGASLSEGKILVQSNFLSNWLSSTLDLVKIPPGLVVLEQSVKPLGNCHY